MHGRLKVRTTAEQQAAKLEEQEKKLKLFSAAWNRLIEKRKISNYDAETLDLSAQILCKIPDVHTLWNVRKETFLYLKSELEEEEYADRCRDELAFTEHCLQVNPKSYGCWEHRCWILDNSPKADWTRELALCNKYLQLDERNFHCWDYRRFIVARSHTKPEDEFKYTTDKISANFSNFSSWHYRSKLLPALYPDTENPVGIKQDILLNELNMVQSAFFTDPNDQSAWFYHRWLLGKAEIAVKCDLVYVSSDRRRLLARFTKPVKNFDAEVMIDSNKVRIVWVPVSLKSKASMIWSASLPEAIEKDSIVTVVFEGNTRFELKMESDRDSWVSSGETSRLAAIKFGKSENDVLINELDMLRQLHDLEPDNKWTMLTIISALRNLNREGFMKEIDKYLEKLIVVDPYRENYYSDMRSKCIVEAELLNHSENLRHCDLSSRRLSQFYHSEHFLTVTHLNLSNNSLKNLKGLHVLQNLIELDASRNHLNTLEHIGSLSSLKIMNIEENYLANRECLDVIRKQPKLTKLRIKGNPVADELTTDEMMKLLQACSLE